MKQLTNLFSKNIVTLAIIAGVIFLIWKFKGIFSGNQTGSPLKNPFSNLSIMGKSKAEIDMIADIQEASMANMGTDFDMLKNSIINLSGSELKRVYNSFGNRKYVTIFGRSGGAFTGIEMSLFKWY